MTYTFINIQQKDKNVLESNSHSGHVNLLQNFSETFVSRRVCKYVANFFYISCPCDMLVSLTYGTNISHSKGNSTLVLMHSGIVNGYQLLFDAHTVLELHRGTAALFLYFTHYRPFPLFFLCVFIILLLFCFLQSQKHFFFLNLYRTVKFLGFNYTSCSCSNKASFIQIPPMTHQ